MTRLLAVLVLGLGAGAAVAEKPISVEYVSDAGKYSVVFPARPKTTEDEKTVATAGGNLTVVTTRCETGRVVYSVTYTDYPESYKDAKPSLILDGVVAGMLGDAKQTSSADVSDKGVPARTVSLTAGENSMSARVLLVGRRLYLVQVSGKQSDLIGDQAGRFLTSFSVAK